MQILRKIMIVDNRFFAATSLRSGRGLVTGAVVAMAMCACGLNNVNPNDEAQVISYEYRTEYGFVRIEHIEPEAADNTQPFNISEDALNQALKKLRVMGNFGNAEPVFTDDELTNIVPPLAAALAKAGPKEDVTFASPGRHGLFGDNSPRTVTTGRLFMRDQQLNLIFGLIQDPFEQRLMDNNSELRPFTPGSRKVRIQNMSEIVDNQTRLVGDRSDWVVFDATRLAAAHAPTQDKTEGANNPTTPKASVDNHYQEIESRLRLLDRLKADRVITEDEYRERRRAILDGI
jgi:hypothetical protein